MKKTQKSGAGQLALLAVYVVMAVSCSSKAAPPLTQDGDVVLYITRHGRTLFNTMDRAQGWADTPLTAAGIETARALGRGLADVRFDYVISSDLTRARETARLVMAENKANSTAVYNESDMLREACYGSYEGDFNENMLAAMVKAGNYADFAAFSQAAGKDSWYISADLIKTIDTSGMAEDGITIKNRMQTKLRELAREQAARGGGNVLLIAHGMSINIMLSDIDPSFDYQGTALANAAVCKVRYQKGAFTIESFNDTSYIEKGKR